MTLCVLWPADVWALVGGEEGKEGEESKGGEGRRWGDWERGRESSGVVNSS